MYGSNYELRRLLPSVSGRGGFIERFPLSFMDMELHPYLPLTSIISWPSATVELSSIPTLFSSFKKGPASKIPQIRYDFVFCDIFRVFFFANVSS